MPMSFYTLLPQRKTRTSWRIASHVLFWVFFFSGLTYFNTISFNPYRETPLVYLYPLRTTVSLMVVFYPLVYGVGPWLFGQQRWVAGIVASVGLLLLYALLDYAGETLVLSSCDSCRDLVSRMQPSYHQYLQRGFLAVFSSRVLSMGVLFHLVAYITPPIALKVGLEYHRQYSENLQLSRDNVQLELNFLKAQVNPHFLFNTLNNLYGLILHGRNEQSAETVARLSDFMRYTLYDSAEDQIALEKEIKLIENYIQLEKLRLNYTTVHFSSDTDRSGYSLPPLLFMPLVENAFKYIVDAPAGSALNIRLAVEKGLLHFTVRNTFDPKAVQPQRGGIGLVNLQKRLQLYFPGHHTLETGAHDSCFTAHLTLTLTP